ncbi:C-X-C motif chemokine 10-like [Aulostomus maculatus]
MNAHLLVLAALALLSCFSPLHGFPRRRCVCRTTISQPIADDVIRRLVVIPASGYCRWTQIIVTTATGGRVCVDPDVKWIKNLLENLRKRDATSPPARATYHDSHRLV